MLFSTKTDGCAPRQPVLGLVLIAFLVLASFYPPPMLAQSASDVNKRVAQVQQYLKERELLKALAQAEQLEKDFPEDKRLRDLTQSLRTVVADAIILYGPPHNAPAQTRLRVSYGQLPAMDKAMFAAFQRQFKEVVSSNSMAAAKTLLVDALDFQSHQTNFVRGWLMVAELAIATDNIGAGLNAGTHLSALRAYETENPDISQLLARLEEKGWYRPPTK